MASLYTLEQRIRTLEARLAEIEGGYGDTIYKLHGDVMGVKIGQSRILNHLGIPDVTDDDIDRVLDDQDGNGN